MNGKVTPTEEGLPRKSSLDWPVIRKFDGDRNRMLTSLTIREPSKRYQAEAPTASSQGKGRNSGRRKSLVNNTLRADKGVGWLAN